VVATNDDCSICPQPKVTTVTKPSTWSEKEVKLPYPGLVLTNVCCLTSDL